MLHASRRDAEALVAWTIDEAKKRGAFGADAIYLRGGSSHLVMRDGNIEDDVTGGANALSLRTLDSAGRQGIAYGNAFDRADLLSLIEWSLSNCRNAKDDPYVALFSGTSCGCECDNDALRLEDPVILSGLPRDRRLRICREMTELASSSDKRLLSVRSAAWSDGWEEAFYANSVGVAAWRRETFASCGVAVLLQEGDSVEMGGYDDESHFFSALDHAFVAERAVKKTALVLGGKPVPTGRYTLLLDPEATSSLLAIAGELFCASQIHKNRSLLKGKLGRQIASPCLSLVDDGRLPGGMGTAFFDDEGVPTRRTCLMESGKVKGFLYNIRHANEDGATSTGNASRGMASPPDVDITNLYPIPGERSQAELAGEIGRGLYVTEMMGLHTVDSASGDFSLGVKGALIADGEIASPVAETTIAGNILELLKHVVVLGNDLKFFGSVGGCSMVVEGIAVAGK
jgi:PmbA protein